MTNVKFVKDPNIPRDDVYKSGTVHVPQGLPPNSESRPTPRMRSTQQYSQTSFNRPAGGQSTQPTYPQSRPVPSMSRPGQRQPNESVAVTQRQATRPHPQAQRQPPPPPPPPPPAPSMQPPAPVEPIYRALYDFIGQTSGEMSFTKGEVINITRKENTGTYRLFYAD